jgi:hypothetical protein
MLAEMTPQQLAEWRAYIEGLGETDDQQNAAIGTASIVNAINDLRYIVTAFMSKDAKPDKPTTPEEYVRKWRTDKPKKARVKSTAELFAMFKQHG